MKTKLLFVKNLIKNNTVAFIAFLAALVTCFFIPPDKEYINYFDFRTLTCLFSVLAVVMALRNVRFFYTIAKKIVRKFKNAKMAVLALVYVTFLGSMLIANDMALITFLPLGYLVLESTGKRKYMAFTFIMQNIAANLGGMLTPFGNPQNLYLYSKFEIEEWEFLSIMFPPFILAIALITICCLVFVKAEPLDIDDTYNDTHPIRIAIYLLLFAFSIVIVFRFIPYVIGLIVIIPALLILDRKALKSVDYGLLLTFAFFFIFSGNLARIDAVREFFSALLEKDALIVSLLSCQFISNVPSAILLSQFTDNYRALLYGVNIGGTGTLIASLASLITFRQYISVEPKKALSYVLKFSLFNFALLFILGAFCYLLLLL